MTRAATPRRPRRARRAAAGLLATLALVLAGLAQAAPAAAHAVLESSDPAAGARMGAVPATVTLRFSEEVDVTSRSLRVQDAAGRQVDLGGARRLGDGRGATTRLPPDLGTGSYTVVWQIVSADGHPLGGTYTFGVGVPAGAAPVQEAGDGGVALARWLAQLLGYTGTALLLGGGVFTTVLWPAGAALARTRRLIGAGAMLCAGAALAAFSLQGPYGAGLGLTAALQPELLATTLGSGPGRLLLLRALAVAVAVALLLPRRVSTGDAVADRAEPGVDALSGIVVAGVLLATFALAGHSGQGEPRLLSVGADALHVAAASTWLGGLAVLGRAFLPTADAAARAAVLPRWSRLAMVSVAVLVTTGTYQAWREVGSPAALAATAYGRLVLGKVAGLVALLVLAEIGRRWVRRHAADPVPTGHADGEAVDGDPVDGDPVDGDPGDRGAGPAPAAVTVVTRELVRRPAAVARLRESVLSETAVGVAVLALTALLVAAVPARQAYAPPFSATTVARSAEGDTLAVAVDVEPTRTGAQSLSLRVTGAGAATIGAATAPATGSLVERSSGLGPVRVTFTRGGDGTLAADAVVPTPGTWTLTLQLSTEALTTYTATVTYPVT